MKAIKIIALSMLCALAFSSCQKNYEKLIEGEWQSKADVSYFVEKGKRNYFSDDKKGEMTIKLTLGNMNMLSEEGYLVNNVYNVAEKMNGPYHVDKDEIFIGGDHIHIVKVNNTTMIWERTGDEFDSFHIEFVRIENDPIRMFFANIWYSIPIWVWIIIGVFIIVLWGAYKNFEF